MTGRKPEHEYSARPLPDPAAYSMVYPKVCSGLNGAARCCQREFCGLAMQSVLYTAARRALIDGNLARR